jgi:ferrochelatase
MSATGADRVAVLLMAYGSPRTPADIEAYYTDIRHGRPPTPEQLAELTGRYAAIGGTSPLAARTEDQRAALQQALDAIDADRFDVVLGFKHSEPKIEAAVADIAARGHRRAVALVLAPHHSALSVGEYHDRARAAAAEHDLAVEAIDSWATEPAYVGFLAGEVERAVTAMTAERPGVDVRVVFTAHSLPSRIVAMGDPYPEELHATAAAVAAAVGLDARRWSTAWQSAARTGEPWLGPDIGEVIDALADEADGPARGLVACACGFVSDHLEVLYDLDVVAARRAAQRGIDFARTRCMNADPGVLAALAARVARATR